MTDTRHDGADHEDRDLQMVRDLLAYIGEDPAREGLLETPSRFL